MVGDVHDLGCVLSDQGQDSFGPNPARDWPELFERVRRDDGALVAADIALERGAAVRLLGVGETRRRTVGIFREMTADEQDHRGALPTSVDGLLVDVVEVRQVEAE